MKKRKRRASRLPKGPALVAVGAALVIGACGPKNKQPQVGPPPQPPPQPAPPQDPAPPQAVPPEMPDPDAPQPPGRGIPSKQLMPFLLGPFDR